MKQTIEYVEGTHDYIFLVPVKTEMKVGLIHAPDMGDAAENAIATRGRVHEVGPGVVQEHGKRKPPACERGDLIYFLGKGKPCIVNGTVLLRIQDYQVTCIIRTRAETDEEEQAREALEAKQRAEDAEYASMRAKLLGLEQPS